eukprot:SAG22_NODE_202_length_15324_cov_7.802627_10_plen_218_part_00
MRRDDVGRRRQRRRSSVVRGGGHAEGPLPVHPPADGAAARQPAARQPQQGERIFRGRDGACTAGSPPPPRPPTPAPLRPVPARQRLTRRPPPPAAARRPPPRPPWQVVFRTTPQTNKIELKEYLKTLYAPRVETTLEDGTVASKPDPNYFGKVNTTNALGKVVSRMSPSERSFPPSPPLSLASSIHRIQPLVVNIQFSVVHSDRASSRSPPPQSGSR